MYGFEKKGIYERFLAASIGVNVKASRHEKIAMQQMIKPLHTVWNAEVVMPALALSAELVSIR